MKRLMIRGRICRLLILATFSAAGSCVMVPRAATLIDYLPRETDVPGWTIEAKEQIRSESNLRRRDQALADYGVSEMVTALYRRISDPERTVMLDIARFSSTLDAFGVFTIKRTGGNVRLIDENTAVFQDGAMLRLGRYFVTIVISPQHNTAEKDLDLFVQAVRQNLAPRAGGQDLPDTVFFLSNDKSTREITYYKKGISALPGIANLFIIPREIEGRRYQIFYRRSAGIFDAEREFQHLVRNGFMLTRIGAIQPAVRVVKENEFIFVASYRRWIFGVLNAESFADGSSIIVLLYGEVRRRSESVKVHEDY